MYPLSTHDSCGGLDFLEWSEKLTSQPIKMLTNIGRLGRLETFPWLLNGFFLEIREAVSNYISIQWGNINCICTLIRRALESPQLGIRSLMLHRSHLELMEKTELEPISLKEEMLPHGRHTHQTLCVCVCSRTHLPECVYPLVSMAVCTCLCVWLTCCWFVGDCLFPGTTSVYSWWLTANLWSRD